MRRLLSCSEGRDYHEPATKVSTTKSPRRILMHERDNVAIVAPVT
jgi:hypothetical protein